MPPPNVRVLALELVGDGVRGLTDDLEQPLGGPLTYRVPVERLTSLRYQRSQLRSGLEGVSDPQVVGTAQIGTASRRM